MASSLTTATVSAVTVPSGDPVIAAAGDIACDPSDSKYNGGKGKSGYCQELATSNLLVGAGLAAVLPLGDNQYACGGLSAYQTSYDASWGRVKAISYPATGNHEYQTSGGTDCDRTGHAAGYYSYYGSVAGDPSQGWYSFNVGAWHLISLNAQCGSIAGGCGTGSPEMNWLNADLAANTSKCTLAYWHQPRFSSTIASPGFFAPEWSALYAAGADVVLNGHIHVYERMAPETPSGIYDPANGIREFVVGTGGENHASWTGSTRVNSEARNDTAFGVLKLKLHPSSYDWRFVPANSATYTDSGSSFCH